MKKSCRLSSASFEEVSNKGKILVEHLKIKRWPGRPNREPQAREGLRLGWGGTGVALLSDDVTTPSDELHNRRRLSIGEYRSFRVT
jgi:hypothetical protein